MFQASTSAWPLPTNHASDPATHVVYHTHTARLMLAPTRKTEVRSMSGPSRLPGTMPPHIPRQARGADPSPGDRGQPNGAGPTSDTNTSPHVMLSDDHGGEADAAASSASGISRTRSWRNAAATEMTPANSRKTSMIATRRRDERRER